MNYMFPLLFLILFSCKNTPKNNKAAEAKNEEVKSDTSYVWTKLLDSAEWKKSYNFQMFTIGDNLWTFHADGNWFSTDGIHWAKSTLTNAIYNLAFLDYIEFRNTILGLGHFEGNIERFIF